MKKKINEWDYNFLSFHFLNKNFPLWKILNECFLVPPRPKNLLTNSCSIWYGRYIYNFKINEFEVYKISVGSYGIFNQADYDMIKQHNEYSEFLNALFMKDHDRENFIISECNYYGICEGCKKKVVVCHYNNISSGFPVCEECTAIKIKSKCVDIKNIENLSENINYVYFVSSDDRYIKIGQTNNISKRLKGMQTGNPHKLELKLLYEQNEEVSEKKFHYMFSKYRKLGEWFKNEGDLKYFISHVNSQINIINATGG